MSHANEPSDRELSYLRFARRVLSDLAKWVGNDGPRRRETSQLLFTEDGIGLETGKALSLWPPLKEHYGVDVWGTAEAEGCVRQHLNSGILLPPKLSDAKGTPIVAPTFDQMKSFLTIELLRPLVAAAERHDSIELSDSQVLDTYRAASTLWTAAEFERYALIPLSQFQGDIDHLLLGTSMELSPFLPAEKTANWMLGAIPFGGPDLWQYQEARFKLLAKQIVPRGSRFSDSAVASDTYHFVSALRLLKPGAVGSLGTFTGAASGRSTGYGWPPPELSVQRVANAYTLTVGETATALALFHRLRDGFQRGSLAALGVALRRFNLSYSRAMPEDKIIDLTIALESSLLFDQTQELSYRLGLRAARLLHGTQAPENTQRLLAAIYDARSQIVHNGKSLDDSIKRGPSAKIEPALREGNDLVERAEEVTRAALRQYVADLDSRKSLKAVNQCLDDDITRGTAS